MTIEKRKRIARQRLMSKVLRKNAGILALALLALTVLSRSAGRSLDRSMDARGIFGCAPYCGTYNR